MTSAATHQHGGFSRLAITVGATVLAIGLLTTGSVLYSTDNASAVPTPTFGTFSRAVETPAMLEIVPSPVIETNNEFFFGTGQLRANDPLRSAGSEVKSSQACCRIPHRRTLFGRANGSAPRSKPLPTLWEGALFVLRGSQSTECDENVVGLSMSEFVVDGFKVIEIKHN
jgi:hypothetical protein